MTPVRTTVLPDPHASLAEGQSARARADLTGCPWHDVKAMLRQVGLRPTRQRMALGWILFAKGDRHLTAEMLYEEATKAKVPVSLATVYNALHQFTEVGLLRQVAVDGSKTYFDTNVSDHHHFDVLDGLHEGAADRQRQGGAVVMRGDENGRQRHLLSSGLRRCSRPTSTPGGAAR